MKIEKDKKKVPQMNTDKHRSDGTVGWGRDDCRTAGGIGPSGEAWQDALALEGKGRLDHRWTQIRKTGAQPQCEILGVMNIINSSWLGGWTGLGPRAPIAQCHLSLAQWLPKPATSQFPE